MNFPRRVYDKCTDQLIGKYVSDSDWDDSCYRSISDFMLPDGAVLENIDPSKTEKVKVIALRGDDFLKHLSQEEVGAHTRNYALNLSDLPSTALIEDTGSSDSSDFIGNMPTEGILNNGDPSVIHGKVVFEPPQASSQNPIYLLLMNLPLMNLLRMNLLVKKHLQAASLSRLKIFPSKIKIICS